MKKQIQFLSLLALVSAPSARAQFPDAGAPRIFHCDHGVQITLTEKACGGLPTRSDSRLVACHGTAQLKQMGTLSMLTGSYKANWHQGAARVDHKNVSMSFGTTASGDFTLVEMQPGALQGTIRFSNSTLNLNCYEETGMTL